jgi:PAS domain-containing protein
MPNVKRDPSDPRSPELATPAAHPANPKRIEEALLRSQDQLAGIIESAMDAIITVDEMHQIVLFNGAAERMFATTSDEAIGKPLDRFIPERFRSSHSAHIQAFGDTRVTRRSTRASPRHSHLQNLFATSG